MFLQLAHTKFAVHNFSQELMPECYRITKQFPGADLNLAEGCSRRSETERKRFFEISRGSVIEIDTATGFAHKLSYTRLDGLKPPGGSIIKTFKIILSAMIRHEANHH